MCCFNHFPGGRIWGIHCVSSKDGKNTTGETYLFRYAEENDNPVITNIEREDEYMAAAEAFHDFIANLKSETELSEEDK